MSSLSFDILRLCNFRLLLITRLCVGLALQSQSVIVGWQVYNLTHDPFLLGLTGLTEAVPAILCALVAGHIVDINHPRHTYLFCLGALALNTFTLLMIAGGIVPAPGGHVLPWIFSGVFISGVARAFIMPSSFALLPHVVERKDYPAASAWMSSSMQTAMMTGPALAGLIYGGYGPRGAWLMPVFTISLAFLMMLLLRTPPHVRSAENNPPAWESIREGWRFILSKPVLLSVMTLDMFAVLLGGAVAMLPAYADQVLHVGSEGLGLLRAAPAMGAVTMALILAVRPMQQISARRLLWAVTGFGFCMIGFGLSKIFLLSALFLIISGVFDSISVIIRGTLMQVLIPDRLRGRVSAVNSMFIISSNEIGSFESGVAARFLGLVPSVVIGGIGTLLVVAIISALSPQFRKTVVEANEKEE